MAGYSSQSGRSSRLIQHIGSDLKGSQINELKKMLVTRLKSMTEDTLAWISELPTPLTLQHLVRDSIILTLSHRAMQDVSSLAIPKHLILCIIYSKF